MNLGKNTGLAYVTTGLISIIFKNIVMVFCMHIFITLIIDFCPHTDKTHKKDTKPKWEIIHQYQHFCYQPHHTIFESNIQTILG